MSGINATSAPVVAVPAPVDPSDPANFPAADVVFPRSTTTTVLRSAGAVVGGVGVVGLAASLLKGLGRGPLVRPNMGVLVALGGVALLGAALLGSSFAVPPHTARALAANIPTRDLARLVELRISGSTKIEQAVDGTWAVVRERTYSSGSGGGSSSGGYRSRPSSGGGYSSSPSYPTPSGGRTSPGDDGGSSSRGNSTSNGNPSEDDF